MDGQQSANSNQDITASDGTPCKPAITSLHATGYRLIAPDNRCRQIAQANADGADNEKCAMAAPVYMAQSRLH